MSLLITAVIFTVSATLAHSKDSFSAYWYGGHFVALILALPLFLRLYRQRKGVKWTVILRSEWEGMLLWLAAAMILGAVFIWQFEKRYPVTGFVSHLQTFGGLALFTFYFLVAPIAAYYVSQWKKRESAWAFFTFFLGPGFLLSLLLLPERETAPGPTFSKGFIKFFDPYPASLFPPITFRELVTYIVIGIGVLALFVWFVISTRPVPLK